MSVTLTKKPRRPAAAPPLTRSAVPATARILGSLRTDYGLTQGLIVRLSGYSPRAIANWEAGSKATEPAARKFTELERLFSAIASLTQDPRRSPTGCRIPTPPSMAPLRCRSSNAARPTASGA